MKNKPYERKRRHRAKLRQEFRIGFKQRVHNDLAKNGFHHLNGLKRGLDRFIARAADLGLEIIDDIEYGTGKQQTPIGFMNWSAKNHHPL